MSYKKYYRVLVLFIFIIGLGACSNDEVYTISFYNDEIEMEEYKNLTSKGNIELPILEEVDMIFIGWSIGEEIFYDEYTVTSDITLTAVFEVVSEVFEYEIFGVEGDEKIAITGYIGNATHLKIPQTIDGLIVVRLGQYSFEESDLVEVIIPIDASIEYVAFHNSIYLKEVSFYGNYLMTASKKISRTEYENILLENSEECIITEGSIEEGSWTFEIGCPIREVVEKGDSIIIDYEEYYNYQVLFDRNYYQDYDFNFINPYAFKGATSLETFHIPGNYIGFYPSMFLECINLKNIIVGEDNEFFTVVDGVLYNKDVTELIFYPQGLEETTYEIPNTVIHIMHEPFNNNSTLEVIVINELLETGFYNTGLPNLKEFIVHEDNEKYYAIDGVLFSGDILIKYPAAKTDTSYTLPPGILRIGYGAFSKNRYLEIIDLGNELEIIGLRAFYLSEKLVVLDIPSSVIFVDSQFISESSINTLIINRSFITDGSITDLYPFIGTIDRDNFSIYIPDDSMDEYKADDDWMSYAQFMINLSEYVED